MFGFFTKTLRRKLITLMIIASLVPVIVVSFFAIKNFTDNLYDIQINNINTDLSVLTEAMIHQELQKKTSDMALVIDNQRIMNAIDKINSDYQLSQEKKSAADNAYPDSAELSKNSIDIKEFNAVLDKLFSVRAKMFGFKDFYVLNKSGLIIYALNHKNKVGISIENIKQGPFKRSWEEVIKLKIPVYSDLETSSFNDSTPTMYLMVPEIQHDSSVDKVFVGVLDGDWLIGSINDYSNLARTDGVDVHIVGMDGKVRMSKDRNLASTHSIGEDIKSEIIEHMIKDKKWAGIATDEEGVRVVAATIPFDTSIAKGIHFDFKWGISMEVPEERVFGTIYTFAKAMIITAFITVIIFALIAIIFANSISKPISLLAEYAREAANGNLCINMNLKARRDEIEVLANSFAMMLENLKNQISQSSSASAQLSSSMSEIATTITQLSSSVTETTAAVNEITSTIEEVRQVSNIAHQRAEEMAGKADSVREVSDEGKNSTEKVSNGIAEINRQVESIAATTIKLGDQTKNISEIIDSVTDIADQSNLLSVNASIEAAKAGEYGRGFSVVAREIKSLADKSKESTKQIKDILTEIQKSASGAIMATEKGTKTVAEGLELSKISKYSIEKLEGTVNDAVETSTQIVASSKEQLNGMNQLFETVGSIKLAMQQNSESIKQLEQEAKNLSDLASTLNEMSKKFKVK